MLLGGLVAACIGAYALVSADAPVALGLPMLALGVVASVAGVAVAGRSSVRTRYRPDPWAGPEWLVGGAGVLVAAAFAAAAWAGVAGMAASVDPPAWPSLPAVALAGLLVAATPAVTAPPIPRPLVEQAPGADRPATEQVAA